MEYIIITTVFLLLMLVYFKVANRYNIIDKPNFRSAHAAITLRGGGIIFPLAFLFFLGNEVLFNDYTFTLDVAASPNFWIFGLGLLLICGISFVDDIFNLSTIIRLFFHFISVSLMLYYLNTFQILPFWAIPICYIMIIGSLNAFNFMDGINGISGIYSLVVLGSLWYVNQYVVPFIDSDFILYLMIAICVFLFFNFRKTARCFLGDIGSFGIAFCVLSLIGLLMVKTEELKWILFLTVYGIEVIFTIVQRLKLKENIFEGHRRHLYQLFAIDLKVDHRIVSIGYSLCQLLICMIIIAADWNGFYTFLIIAVPTSLLYIYLKLKILKQISSI